MGKSNHIHRIIAVSRCWIAILVAIGFYLALVHLAGSTPALATNNLIGEPDSSLSPFGNENTPAAPMATSVVTKTTFSMTDIGTPMGCFTIGDFNGDSRPDLVLTRSNASWIYLNDGKGGWTNYKLSSLAGCYAVGDLNGDGRLDIVLGTNSSSSVVFYNNGGGSWNSVPFGNPGYTSSVAVGDLDNDGRLDIVRGILDNPSVVYYNNGTGGWITQTLGTSHDTSDIALADMDGDGRLDIVQSNWADQAVVYYNSGTHIWYPISLPVGEGGNFTGVAVGDLDGNGLMDIVRGGDGAKSRIYYNNGKGDWTSVYIGIPYSTVDVAVGDINGDGLLDIVQANDSTNSYIYYNDGTGGWLQVPMPYELYPNSPGIALGDINSDGQMDIVMGDSSLSGVVYYSGGTVGWSSKIFGDTTSSGDVAVGDLNKDGLLDIVQFNTNALQSYVYINDGLGGWSASPIGGLDFFTDMSVALADLNGDNRLDIVSAGNNSTLPVYTKIYYNNGGGIWSEVSLGDPARTNSIATGDINRDGRLDILQANNPSSKVYYNNGDGSWTASPLGDEYGTEYGLVGDLNGDGWLDIVLGGYPTRIYYNNGAGGWITTTLEGSSRVGILGDVNGDGWLDIVEGGLLSKSKIYYNNGSSGWSITSFGTKTYPMRIAVNDVNGDGRQEIIQGNGTGSSYIYYNDGFDNWTQVKFSDTPNVTDMALGDLNGDGRLDIVEGVVGAESLIYYQPTPHGYPNNPANINLTRPISTGNANLYSTPIILGSTTIPVTYTLSDRDGEPQNISAFYSLDGGGNWQSAIAASGTVTANLTPRRTFDAASTDVPRYNIDSSVITSTLSFSAGTTFSISDVKVWISINHAQAGDLRLSLLAPNGVKVILMNPSTLSGAISRSILFDTFAPTSILSATVPYMGAYRPVGQLTDFNGLTSNGTWRLRVEDTLAGNPGTLKAWGLQIQNSAGTFVYNWDTFHSNFFGQSDDVVFRLDSTPSSLSNQPRSSGIYSYTNTTPPYPYIHTSTTTYPFRVRSTQVRVMQSGSPAKDALVYRIPTGQSGGGLPFSDTSGNPYKTSSDGYLGGRGILGVGDKLVAMLPITSTNTYTLYFTNATPTPTGLDGFNVSTSGVQTITVSSTHPLIQFNLDVSLQWDARNDSRFLATFEYNLQRASELLYDWSNGQAALGNIRIFHNREHWNDAHLRVYASNQLRPNAVMGGIVSQPITETAVVTLSYAPGQVHMGPAWNRYGEPGNNLGEDWPRTLAHELGHYLFYLDDDYLGLDPSGQLIPVDGCPSAMADPYRQDYPYDEFHPDAGWLAECANTLSNQLSGRSDWGTIHHFYNWLGYTSANTGPSQLPLELTQVTQIAPGVPLTTLEDPTFYISQSGQRVQPGTGTRTFLFQDGWAIDLGRPTLDHILARGARPLDRVCVYELPAQRLGCKTVVLGDEQLPLATVSNWMPDINVTPVNSQTISLQVSNLPTAGLSLEAQLFPMAAQATQPISLTLQGSVYSGTFHLSSPVFEGYMRVLAENSSPIKEMITDFSVGGNPVSMRGSNTSMRGSNVNMRGSNAPVASADGQVILFVDSTNFAPNQFYTLQTVSNIPSPILWANVVGRAYRLTASPDAPDLTNASINFTYLGDEVPTGGEPWLRLYFWDGVAWNALATSLDMYHNNASAPAHEPGIYALMTSMEIPIYGPGWNLVSYPLQVSQTITQALLSISGHFNTVYNYDASNPSDPWKIYDVTVPGWVDDLHSMEFGKGYWINAAGNITWYLPPEPYSSASYGAPLPPTTFYGAVVPSAAFHPTAGMTVTAWVEGSPCGVGTIIDIPTFGLAYVVKVFADDGAAYAGCGQTGRTVTFSVQGRIGAALVPWDNDQVWEVILQDWSYFIEKKYIFLPCSMR